MTKFIICAIVYSFFAQSSALKCRIGAAGDYYWPQHGLATSQFANITCRSTTKYPYKFCAKIWNNKGSQLYSCANFDTDFQTERNRDTYDVSRGFCMKPRENLQFKIEGPRNEWSWMCLCFRDGCNDQDFAKDLLTLLEVPRRSSRLLDVGETQVQAKPISTAHLPLRTPIIERNASDLDSSYRFKLALGMSLGFFFLAALIFLAFFRWRGGEARKNRSGLVWIKW